MAGESSSAVGRVELAQGMISAALLTFVGAAMFASPPGCAPVPEPARASSLSALSSASEHEEYERVFDRAATPTSDATIAPIGGGENPCRCSLRIEPGD